ncbi:MAG: phosphoribosyltransferase [Candidatus Odinarchaeia archaeon]
MVEYYLPSWNEIHLDLIEIANMILNQETKPDIIVAIARGGWVVGRILSDLLNNNNVGNMRIEFYTDIGTTLKKPIISQPLSVNPDGKNILLCDDVADTGKSLKAAVDYLKNQAASEIKIACLHKKPWSIITPDFYLRETDKWIIYPWEYRETLEKIVNSLKAKNLSDTEISNEIMKIGFPKNILSKILKLT